VDEANKGKGFGSPNGYELEPNGSNFTPYFSVLYLSYVLICLFCPS